jgi:hypothetical protein
MDPKKQQLPDPSVHEREWEWGVNPDGTVNVVHPEVDDLEAPDDQED